MKNIRTSFMSLAALAVVCGTALITGCKSTPADKQVFINPEFVPLMEKRENLPFDKAWGEPEKIRQFDKILVAPIVTEHQLERNTWEKTHLRSAEEQQDFEDFAKYTHNAFVSAFDKSSEFKVTEKPGPKTMKLELALVKIVPGKPIVGAISNITNLTPFGLLLIPFKVGGRASADTPMNASVVIEGVLRDSQTGKILGVFADSQKQTAALFSSRDFTAYGNLRQIVDNWAADTVKVLDQVKKGEKADVESSNKIFTLFN